MFTKVKAALIAAALAALAGLGSWAAGFDWSSVDPRWGTPAGMFVTALIAYIVKELSGYGQGVPELDEEIPGGQPLPAGSETEDLI